MATITIDKKKIIIIISRTKNPGTAARREIADGASKSPPGTRPRSTENRKPRGIIYTCTIACSADARVEWRAKRILRRGRVVTMRITHGCSTCFVARCGSITHCASARSPRESGIPGASRLYPEGLRRDRTGPRLRNDPKSLFLFFFFCPDRCRHTANEIKFPTGSRRRNRTSRFFSCVQ